MKILKLILLFFILITSSYIGILSSKSFSNRVADLIEIRNALNIFKIRIRYTFKPLSEVFLEISKEIKPNVANIFLKTHEYLENTTASNAWKKAIEEYRENINYNSEDLNIILDFSKMLGNTDLEGQINNIDMTCHLIDNQIEKARKEELKNEKLYKTLGIGIGLSIVIILI